ncbi:MULTISPECIES: RNA polymerase sigma factor [Arcicella]|uniref:Sigma-70 family RNA polymerase sigma factor n=2 Tax=Arcicella TaxID=217140 RepID=A0ABU5SQ42_9BACT|nr:MULTISPECIES: sigma-70 family RNA polymerase sigma factor [unclassified Arcicella]MEA5402750.1 sigma-70 family RNA polymerase sigma factor [Arcicella sp. DC2W]MEA5429387.1 sigma-70 family RNA polymerase sigma factor [Arcicella sp. DC25W]
MKTANRVSYEETELSRLWLHFKNGSGEAFDQIFLMRYKELYNYATRFTKDKELIKDCLQDLFLELWSHRERLLPENPYVTIYLIKAFKNNLFRKLKIEKRLGNVIDIDDYATLTDGESIESEWIAEEFLQENEKTIRQAIKQLPKRQQEVIYLKYYKGFSNEEIASIMDIERQTVANFLHRSILNLKRNLLTAVEILIIPFLKALFFSL